MNVVVIGGTGLIGSKVVEKLKTGLAARRPARWAASPHDRRRRNDAAWGGLDRLGLGLDLIGAVHWLATHGCATGTASAHRDARVGARDVTCQRHLVIEVQLRPSSSEYSEPADKSRSPTTVSGYM